MAVLTGDRTSDRTYPNSDIRLSLFKRGSD